MLSRGEILIPHLMPRRREPAVLDPNNAVYPLRVMKHYPVPPVCWAKWTDEDWERMAKHTQEVDILQVNNIVWKAVGRDMQGVLLYEATDKTQN